MITESYFKELGGFSQFVSTFFFDKKMYMHKKAKIDHG